MTKEAESTRAAFEAWVQAHFPGLNSAFVSVMRKAWQAATERERERCAKVCETLARGDRSWSGKLSCDDCAAAIRNDTRSEGNGN